MTTDLVALPPSVTSRGIDVAQWNTLCDSLFPGAKTESILLAIDYCKARQLDVMKKPCHIVQIGVKNPNGNWENRDVILPGIYEYRTTAHRTQLYLGHSEPEYGNMVECAGVMAPQWCKMVMYRWHEASKSKIEFPVMVLFAEVVATKQDGNANARWYRAPVQMLTKCTEAAGLREAFPDELGGTQTDDEMYGRTIDVGAVAQSAEPRNVTPENSGSNPDSPSNKRKGKPATREPVRATEKNASAAADETADPSGERAEGDSQGRTTEPADTIIKSQQTLLEHRLKTANIPISELLAVFEIGALAELPFDKMQEAKDWIEKQ